MIDWKTVRTRLVAAYAPTTLPPNIKLPVLPSALLKFSEKAKDPEVSTGLLSRIVETDAGLSCDLLRYVNSVAFGLRNNISSVQQAISMCGIRATHLYLTTCGVKSAMRSSSSKLINFQRFWHINLERAMFAREVAKLLGADSQLAFTGAMLQDFLLPVLTNELLEPYLGFCEDPTKYDCLANYEREKFGWDHAQAASKIMFEWGMPDELICCVSLHHEGVRLLEDEMLGKTSVAAVGLSSLLPDPLKQKPEGLNELLELDSQWGEFELLPIAEKIESELQEFTENASGGFSLFQACKKAMSQNTQ